MDDAYAIYSPGGKPTLVDSAVLFMDILGTSADRDETTPQDYLTLTHAAFAQARNWGESQPGADELKVSAWFSDNLVMAVPLAGWLTPGSVVDLLVMYAAHHQLSFIDTGVFVRGAITFGPFFADEHFVHGPALNEAHDLESRAAGAPRIVLSPSAMDALKEPVDPSEFDVLDAHIKAGDDGVPFVDYLWFADQVAPPEFVERILERHRDNIRTNLERFRRNVRVGQKYDWLAAYFDAGVGKSLQVRPELEHRRFRTLHP